MTNKISYGEIPPKDIHSMSGLALMNGICDGRFPQAPIAEKLGFRLTEVDQGFAVFVGVPAKAFYNPVGSVHGGWYGTLLDSCMGCAVHTSLEKGLGFSTVEYSLNLVRAINEGTGPVRAEGRLIHRGRTLATADGRLLDQDGRLLAHGTTTCMIMPLPELSV
jgi:uncharacterized protein (TIGR00369 family)